jgi:hypothetical protein
MEERRVRRVKKEEKVSNLLWWGYRHVNGAYHVKRFFDDKDINEAITSDFCYAVAGPFEAQNRNEALAITEDKIRTRLGID